MQTSNKKTIFFFGQDMPSPVPCSIVEVGNKGRRLIDDSAMGAPVPPGFVISTDICRKFYETGGDMEFLSTYVDTHVMPALRIMEKRIGHMPLVSIRSTGPVSMPGMMKTLCNVLLGTELCKLQDWRKRIGHKTALDCAIRLVRDWSDVVHADDWGLAAELEVVTDELKKGSTIKSHQETAKLTHLAYRECTGNSFPSKARDQLIGSIRAVFLSHMSTEAQAYREHHGIPNDLYTGVAVCTMIFGNSQSSGTGVFFTRDPSTGDKWIIGEYLPNAQGEDIVSNKKMGRNIYDLHTERPNVWKQIMKIAHQMEARHKDMQEIEFTYNKDKVWVLQSRDGKREPLAAATIAGSMFDEGLIKVSEIGTILSPDQITKLVADKQERAATLAPHDWKGTPSSSGVVKGVVVSDMVMVAHVKSLELRPVLVRPMTTTEDFDLILACDAVVTLKGGITSHAAVVTRALGKPSIVGCGDKAKEIEPLQHITVCGTSGRVFKGHEVEVVSSDEGMGVLVSLFEKVANTVNGAGWVHGVVYRPGEPLPESDKLWIDTREIQDDDGMRELAVALSKSPAGKVWVDLTYLNTYNKGDMLLLNAFGQSNDPEPISNWDRTDALMRPEWLALAGESGHHRLSLITRPNKDDLPEVFDYPTYAGNIETLLDATGTVYLSEAWCEELGMNLTAKLKDMAHKSGLTVATPPTPLDPVSALIDLVKGQQ